MSDFITFKLITDTSKVNGNVDQVLIKGVETFSSLEIGKKMFTLDDNGHRIMVSLDYADDEIMVNEIMHDHSMKLLLRNHGIGFCSILMGKNQTLDFKTKGLCIIFTENVVTLKYELLDGNSNALISVNTLEIRKKVN